MNDVRPIDANALLTVPNVRKVDEFDETGESVSCLAVPVECIEKAPTIGYAPKWISVEERVPDKNVWVLVHMKSASGKREESFIELDKMVKRGWWLTPEEGRLKITHWMPLPEPPMDGGEEHDTP